jgi:UDP-galactopyranose mutase
VEKIFNYVKTFTEFNSYTHRVFATHKNRIYTVPFNLHTLNQVYDQVFSPEDAQIFLNKFRNSNFVKDDEFESLESKAIRMVGKDIYQKLIEGYTIKQWETHPSQLPASIISRLPVRANYDDRYFSDKYQGLPLFGYVNWFNKMLNSERIKIFVDADYFDIKKNLFNLPTIYTGAIDRYFNYCYGELGWRTLNFETETLKLKDFQGTAVMNYTDIDVPFTRIHEYKHLHPEREYQGEYTVISREYSKLATRKDEPYYPINSLADRDKLSQYRKKALMEKNVHFGGRLGSYFYLDMHMAIGSAIQFMENDFSTWFERAQKSYGQEGRRK